MNRPRQLRLRRRLVFAAVAAVLLLLAGEAILRALRISPQSGEEVFADRWLYFPLRAGARDWDENLTLGARVYPPDPLHYNIRAPLTPKPVGTKRILAFGDSSTFGIGVRPLQAYPQVLDRLFLRCDPRERVEVWNFGRPGASSYQGRLLAETIWDTAQPDALVFFFGANDQAPSPVRPDKDWAATPAWSLRLHRALMRRSFLYRLLRSVNLSYLERRALPWFAGATSSPATRPRVSRDDFFANREALRARIEAAGGFLLTIVCGSLDGGRAARCAYFDDWTVGPDDIDLPTLFDRELAAGRRPFVDRVHPSPAGHRALARALFEKIADRWREPACDPEPILAAEARVEAERDAKVRGGRSAD